MELQPSYNLFKGLTNRGLSFTWKFILLGFDFGNKKKNTRTHTSGLRDGASHVLHPNIGSRNSNYKTFAAIYMAKVVIHP